MHTHTHTKIETIQRAVGPQEWNLLVGVVLEVGVTLKSTLLHGRQCRNSPGCRENGRCEAYTRYRPQRWVMGRHSQNPMVRYICLSYWMSVSQTQGSIPWTWNHRDHVRVPERKPWGVEDEAESRTGNADHLGGSHPCPGQRWRTSQDKQMAGVERNKWHRQAVWWWRWKYLLVTRKGKEEERWVVSEF